MPTNNKPLWQQLNEQRTQGEWTLFKDKLNREWNIISKDEFEILTISNKWRSFETNEANANYTALAVNNLHEYSGCNFKLTNNKKTNYYETVCNNDFTGTSFTKSCKHKFA